MSTPTYLTVPILMQQQSFGQQNKEIINTQKCNGTFKKLRAFLSTMSANLKHFPHQTVG